MELNGSGKEFIVEASKSSAKESCSTIGKALASPTAILDKCCAGKRIDMLNDSCFCMSLDPALLRTALASEINGDALFRLLEERCPYVFAAQPVFISDSHVRKMEELIRAIESVVALPAYRDMVLAKAPSIAQHTPPGAKSVFFGYDFHLHDDGVALIELNTNAGGAMLNAILAKAQQACCAPVALMLPAANGVALENQIMAMFQNEWQSSRMRRPLKTIAIIDEHPEQQYLYPEFLLFERLFQQHGFEVVISSPEALRYENGTLWHGDTAIDLAYNRLTDFMLAAPASRALKEAYLADAIVLTPHPQAHALYANKRNLALLTDPQKLNGLDVPPSTREILLAGIPPTEIVSISNADRLWAQRRQLFFKPAAGYGSRAAYRGDKLTKRVWEEILGGDYVAQALVAPRERSTNSADMPKLKFDIRAYAYDGKLQWIAARLYQGQTTNFRTPGGGFAPVYHI